MTEKDLKDLLLGKATRYSEGKITNYWQLLNQIDLIYNNNCKYESYNLDNMLKDLYNYLKEE